LGSHPWFRQYANDTGTTDLTPHVPKRPQTSPITCSLQKVSPTAEVEHELTRREQGHRVTTLQGSIGTELWHLTTLSLGVAPAGHIYLEH
jgi:hypothetical protein